MVQIIFLSCVKESRMYSRQYSLKNETNQNIKLKFYFKYNEQLVYGEIIKLNDTEVFNGGFLETDQPHSNDVDYPINTFKASDSVVIIFNNEKRNIMFLQNGDNIFSTPIDRNVFRHGNYVNMGGNNFQFTITEEDYNNAEDCNGDCD